MTYSLCAGTIIMAQMKYFGTMEKEDDHMSQRLDKRKLPA